MPKNSFKKYIRAKSRLEKSQRPFESDLSSIDGLRVTEFGTMRERGFVKGTLLSSGEEVTVIREYNSKFSDEDLFTTASKKIKPGGIMMLEGVRKLDPFSPNSTETLLSCVGFSTLSDGTENVKGKLTKEIPVLVSSVKTDKFGAYQVYYEIDVDNSIKVTNPQEAVSAIRSIMSRDSSVTQNGFIIRGYSKEENIASSIQFKSVNSFLGNKPSDEKVRSKLEAFFENEEVVTIVGGDNTDIIMKPLDYLNMMTLENTDVTWEVIPTIEHKQTFKISTNKSLEDQLIQRANDISRSYRVGQTAGYNMSIMGLKEVQYPNGNIYNTLMNIKHSDQRMALPIAAIATKFSNPELDLGLLESDISEEYEVSNSMLDIMEMFDEDETSTIEVTSDVLSNEYDILNQPEFFAFLGVNIENKIDTPTKQPEIEIEQNDNNIELNDDLDFDDDLSFLKEVVDSNSINDTELDFDDDLSFLSDGTQDEESMDFDDDLSFLKEETETYTIRDVNRGYGVDDEFFQTKEAAESAAISRSATTGGNFIVETNSTRSTNSLEVSPNLKSRKPRSTPIDKITDDHWVMIKRNGSFINSSSELIQVLSPSDTAPKLGNYGADQAIRVSELIKLDFKGVDIFLKKIGKKAANKLSVSADHNVDDIVNTMFGKSDNVENKPIIVNFSIENLEQPPVVTLSDVNDLNEETSKHDLSVVAQLYFENKKPGDSNPEMEKWIETQNWSEQTISADHIPDIEVLFDYDDHFDRIIYIDQETVNSYIQTIQNDIDLNPIIVGKNYENGKLSIIDGNHRAYAYKSLGREIPVYISDSVYEQIKDIKFEFNPVENDEKILNFKEEKEEFLAASNPIFNNEKDIEDEDLDNILNIIKL